MALLRNIGFALEQVLPVDDSARTYARHPENLVPVLPYLGGTPDRGLRRLARYLPTLKELPDVRIIEKRAWHTQPVDSAEGE